MVHEDLPYFNFFKMGAQEAKFVRQSSR
jgi:hypothetical protein